MAAKNNIPDQTHYVAADRLRIGLYVYIDLPWFQHPFTLNSFRIGSDDQIHALTKLGISRFRYDPERSLPANEEDEGDAPALADEDVVPTPPPATDPHTPETLNGKESRIRVLSQHRQRIEKVNRAFLKSTTLLRNLNRNLMNAPTQTLAEMGGLVDQMVLAFLEHPEATLHMMGEECGGDEIFSHSLNVTVLCMMLAKGLELTPEQARTLGLGAMLHDIGLMDVPDRLLKLRPDEYTRPERDLRARHCEYGLRIGKQLGLPADILAIIFQHHEMVDGSGYPLGSKQDKITLPARIVALVNYYDNLCNPIDYAQAMTPHEALSFLFGQRRNKFDAVVLQRLIRCLGVYPPGSVVTLSNDAMAMVISVNPARPLRPWVKIYDEKVPKEEAILLDLEQETEITIINAVRPALLPPAIATYLSPRKRISYFFDSSAQPAQGGI